MKEVGKDIIHMKCPVKPNLYQQKADSACLGLESALRMTGNSTWDQPGMELDFSYITINLPTVKKV